MTCLFHSVNECTIPAHKFIFLNGENPTYLFLQEIVKGLNMSMNAYDMHWCAQVAISNVRI